MSTHPIPSLLSAALFGQARRAVLSLLYSRPDEGYYLRHIARVTGVGLGAVQRELQRLSSAGIIQRTVRGHQVYFQANALCPVFVELRELIRKTSGAGTVLGSALGPLAARIQAAFIYGSVAKGAERAGSDVDLLVVGDLRFDDLVAALHPAQKELAREVNPTLYSPAEFRSKIRVGHHFLTAVLQDARIFVIGDEVELSRLAAKRMAHRAS